MQARRERVWFGMVTPMEEAACDISPSGVCGVAGVLGVGGSEGLGKLSPKTAVIAEVVGRFPVGKFGGWRRNEVFTAEVVGASCLVGRAEFGF